MAGFKQAAEFFETVRYHVLEGVFCEPQYGGNRDMIGWRLVNFPGQQFRLCRCLRQQSGRFGARGCGLLEGGREISVAEPSRGCLRRLYCRRRRHGRHSGEGACLRRIESRRLRARSRAEKSGLRAARFDSLSHSSGTTGMGAARTDDDSKQNRRNRLVCNIAPARSTCSVARCFTGPVNRRATCPATSSSLPTRSKAATPSAPMPI